MAGQLGPFDFRLPLFEKIQVREKLKETCKGKFFSLDCFIVEKSLFIFDAFSKKTAPACLFFLNFSLCFFSS